MGARMSPAHNPVAALTAVETRVPVSSGAATLDGLGVDLQGKRGCYFVVATGALTGLATVAAYIQESTDNSNFTNVNVTTYPDATLAASNAASGVREMWVRRDQVARYVRAEVVIAANTALTSCVAVAY